MSPFYYLYYLQEFITKINNFTATPLFSAYGQECVLYQLIVYIAQIFLDLIVISCLQKFWVYRRLILPNRKVASYIFLKLVKIDFFKKSYYLETVSNVNAAFLQSEIRSISVNQWGSQLGLSVLSKLSQLYCSLVWESTVLLSLCTPNR